MITNNVILKKLEQKTKNDPELCDVVKQCLEIESEGRRPHYQKKYEQIVTNAVKAQMLKEGGFKDAN